MKISSQNMQKRHIPIQFHSNKTLDEIREHHVSGWKNDDSLREYKTALIVFDPKKQFETLQKDIKWYPKDVLKEKLNWLYAEAVFTFVDRFSISKKRSDVYYAEAMKIHIMRLLGNAVLMLHKEYPSFDKHLHARINRLMDERKFTSTFDHLLDTYEFGAMSKGLQKLLMIVEEKLIEQKFATKKVERYWIDLRPKHQVEIISR